MSRPLVWLVAIDQELGDQVRTSLSASPWLVKDLTLADGDGCDSVAGNLTLLVTPSLDAEAFSLIIQLSRPDCPPVLVVAPVEQPLSIADALKSGATDVTVYPFARAELTARVASILRRQQWNDADQASPLLVLDSLNHTLAVGDRHLDFPPREWTILQTLIEHDGTPVATVRLARTEDGARLSRSTVVATVSRLRNRLRRLGVAGIDVHAIPGRGYQLNLTLPVHLVIHEITASPPLVMEDRSDIEQI